MTDEFTPKVKPTWANWLAQDSDGLWWWYEKQPFFSTDGTWKSFLGKFERIDRDEIDYSQTLRYYGENNG